MPIDPNIALSVKPMEMPDPLQKYMQAQTLRNAMVQSETGLLQQQQLRTTMQEAQAVKGLFGDPGNYDKHQITGQPKLKDDAAMKLRAHSPQAWEQYSKAEDEKTKSFFQLHKEQAEVQIKELEEQKRIYTLSIGVSMAGVKAYDAAKEAGKSDQEASLLAKQAELTVRQDLIDHGLLKPDAPSSPTFDYQKSLAHVNSQEKFSEYFNQKKERIDKGWETIVGAGYHFIDHNKISGQTRDTGIVQPPHYSGNLVPITDKEGNSKTVTVDSQGKITEHDVQKTGAGGGKLTKGEETATAQWNEMDQAAKNLASLSKGTITPEGKALKVTTAPYASWIYNMHQDEGFTNNLQNWFATKLMSPEEQAFMQAARQFCVAGGHQMNGSRITEVQFKLLWHTYIPQPGDSALVIEQKGRARANFLESAKAMGGKGPEMLEQQRRKDQAEIDKAVAEARRGKGPDANISPAGVAGKGGMTLSIDPKTKTGTFTNAAPPAEQKAAPAAQPSGGQDVFPEDMRQHLPKDGKWQDFKVGDEIQTWTLENGQPKRVK